MRALIFALCVAAGGAVAIISCAKGEDPIPIDDQDSGPVPNPCAACKTGEVCSQGQCKAMCDSPLAKCASPDGGAALCVDVKTDPMRCGSCTNVCKIPDA